MFVVPIQTYILIYKKIYEHWGVAGTLTHALMSPRTILDKRLLRQMTPWMIVPLNKCLLGQKFPWTKVSLDKSPWDKSLFGQKSPRTKVPSDKCLLGQLSQHRYIHVDLGALYINTCIPASKELLWCIIIQCPKHATIGVHGNFYFLLRMCIVQLLSNITWGWKNLLSGPIAV